MPIRTAAPASRGGDGGTGGGGDDCRTRDFIAKFEIVAAFDAAPVPVDERIHRRERPGARYRRLDGNHDRRAVEMKMTSTNRLIVAMLALAALAVAFWMLALGPKRQEASDLGAKVEELKASLAQHEQEAAVALAARESFPADYQQLVVLGKAVPGDDDTASLLVQLNRIAGTPESRSATSS